MSDEPSRSAEVVSLASRQPAKLEKPEPRSEFDNCEFLETSLADPLNVLRSRIKDLTEIGETATIRRVVVVTEILGEEGRGVNVVWSEGEDEPTFEAMDSVFSMLSKVCALLVLPE